MPAGVNSVNEEIKNEAKKVLQSKTGWEKVKYFVYYYKWPVIGVLVVALMVGSLVYDFATRKDSIFLAIIANGEYREYCDYDAIIEPFAETLTYDKKKEEVVLDSSIHADVHSKDQTSQMSIQRIYLNITAKELDLLICDEELMKLTCSQSCASDLAQVLPKDFYDKYEDCICMYDRNSTYYEDDFAPEPEDMQQYSEEERYVAYSIDVSDFVKIKETNMFPYTDGKAYAIIPVNTQHLDYAIDFLRYLDTP